MLQGLELTVGKEYKPIAPWETAAGPVLASEVLGLELRVTKDGLRFRDPKTGQYLSSRAEDVAARVEAEARADTEAEANAVLAAQVAELKVQLGMRLGG